MNIRIGVNGICGKTGGLIARAILKREKMSLICGFERPGHPLNGTDFGKFLKEEQINVPIIGSDQLSKVLDQASLDVVVDFSSASSSIDLLKLCSKKSVQAVIGTTGFSNKQQSQIDNLVKKTGISAVQSSNYGIAANVMFKIVGLAAKALERNDYDIEIMDYHPRTKPDAPSGTAMTLGKIVADEIGWDLEKVAKFGREHRNNHPIRPKEEICFHSLRSGCVDKNGSPGIYLAENTIFFGGPWDRLDIAIHDFGMEAIVPGVLSAIVFLSKHFNQSKIYSMIDVLEL